MASLAENGHIFFVNYFRSAGMLSSMKLLSRYILIVLVSLFSYPQHFELIRILVIRQPDKGFFIFNTNSLLNKLLKTLRNDTTESNRSWLPLDHYVNHARKFQLDIQFQAAAYNLFYC